jgi:hypothetical protein
MHGNDVDKEDVESLWFLGVDIVSKIDLIAPAYPEKVLNKLIETH